ncbi:MAG: substrate-binding domain-containing protein [Gemmatimonadales bacterium]|nr:substrate-binding domain-containing protein [Gemmatimonadales bacterium]
MSAAAYRAVILALVAALLAVACSAGGATHTTAVPARGSIILATTTSTQDSGLLDVLLPLFEKRTGWTAKPIAVGSGQAMTMGRRGDADVLLVHSPDAEAAFMNDGYGQERQLVMHNDFVIVGPVSDPAATRGKSATDAFRAIAARGSTFISRGDDSGTNALERKLWSTAGIDPKGRGWYQESGQGMGATLQIADQKSAYTLSDRATYLSLRSNLTLLVLNEGDGAFLNVYHVITVSQAKNPGVNAAGARAFADFIVGKEAQDLIATFGKEKYGQPLFVADAGKTDARPGAP